MKNNNSAESSASSQTPPPPPDDSSRRRSGSGGNASNASPRGRGAPLRHSWEPHLFNLPRPAVPPVMGVPGRTAFRPYRPPAPAPLWQPSGGHSAFRPYRPPAPHWPGAGPSGSRGLGFQGAARGAVPVGGSGAAATAGTLRIGASPSGRKRAREGGAGAGGGGGGNKAGDGGGRPHNCSVCNKEFGSSKALFGHMRSHPDRGWKGAHPPPSFKAEEEFADLRAGTSAAAAVEEEEGENEAGEGTIYRVPDLNHPPPPDAP